MLQDEKLKRQINQNLCYQFIQSKLKEYGLIEKPCGSEYHKVYYTDKENKNLIFFTILRKEKDLDKCTMYSNFKVNDTSEFAPGFNKNLPYKTLVYIDELKSKFDFFITKSKCIIYKEPLNFLTKKDKSNCGETIINKSRKSHFEESEIKNFSISKNNISDKSKKSPKIQKEYLKKLLFELFSNNVEIEKTYPWLKTGNVNDTDLSKIFNALKNYRGYGQYEHFNNSVMCDFVCESIKTIIEYDESQHFSEARKISLINYPTKINLCYDKDEWIKECEIRQAKDNSPIYRDEQRAYRDSMRDILSSKNGYKLIRIMHGAIDWTDKDAKTKLIELLGLSTNNIKEINSNNISLKVGLYLQNKTVHNQKDFNTAMEIARNSNIDILVFPEFCYTPQIEGLKNLDVLNSDDYKIIERYCLELSKQINKAVIVSSNDIKNRIYSIFANTNATASDTKVSLYIKHTMTDLSAFDIKDYRNSISKLFDPILFNGIKIGLTICYDCNHSIFSRMYGINNIDVIINSTGGDVVYDKWYKYNKTRAIENNCYNFVVMGGKGDIKNPHSYVYGFNRNGKELSYKNLYLSNNNSNNLINTIYVFDTDVDDNDSSNELSIDQKQNINKKNQFYIPYKNVQNLIDKSIFIKENLYCFNQNNENIIFCILDEISIMKPEKVLSLLYSDELKTIKNKKYILVNRHRHLDEKFYKTKLSIILKVRSMENFCATILESDTENHCYQTGYSRTVQVIPSENNLYGLDLDRMSGPEAIWKNKEGMKQPWRVNFEELISKLNEIGDNEQKT